MPDGIKPHGLRDLSRKIKDVTLAHPCCSQALVAVEQVCDHLEAIARTHEANHELDKKERRIEELVTLIQTMERVNGESS